MSIADLTYQCLNCGKISTPAKREPFVTEYECNDCFGKVKGDKERQAIDKWRSVYAGIGLPTIDRKARD